MSSLAAARADNFYYDPNRFDPSKKGRGSYNALANSHPLGVRAARLKSQGILVIRFELPYDGWCLGCGIHVARGVRYNADKKRVGNYFTTPIYEFRMKCTACPSIYVIRTDPQHTDYTYVEGIRKMVKSFDPADSELPKGKTFKEEAKLATDALYKLEHATDDIKKAAIAQERLSQLVAMSDSRWADDFSANQALRKRARAERAEAASQQAEGAALGLNVPLLPASPADTAAARLMLMSKEHAGPARGAFVGLGASVSGPISQSAAYEASGAVTGPRKHAMLSQPIFNDQPSGAPGAVISSRTSNSGLLANGPLGGAGTVGTTSSAILVTRPKSSSNSSPSASLALVKYGSTASPTLTSAEAGLVKSQSRVLSIREAMLKRAGAGAATALLRISNDVLPKPGSTDFGAGFGGARIYPVSIAMPSRSGNASTLPISGVKRKRPSGATDALIIGLP